MADGASSPLFMPQGTPEGNTPPPRRGDGSGSGNGNGNGSGNGSIKSEQGTPEPQSNLQASRAPGSNMEPEVKDEQPPSPLRQFNAFRARGRPTPPFAPLTSRAERNRRKAAAESATLDHATANTAPESPGRGTQTAARDSAAHNNTSASNTLRGNAPTQPSTQAAVAPRRQHPAPPAPQTVDTRALIGNAHRHLNALAADLRKEQNDACEREEHLASLLEHAREIRARAIQDRSNGLVIIRDRKKKLEELERRLLNNETIDPAEFIGLVDPLKLEEPVERGEFERMKVEGRREEHEDGYESDPFGSG